MQRITLSRLLEDFSSIFSSVFLLIIFLTLSGNTWTSLLVGKESAYNAGDPGSISGSGRSPGEMATHTSILAWRIPRAGQPGRLQSMGLHGAGQDWALTHASGLLSGKEMNFCLGTFTPLLTFSSRTDTKWWPSKSTFKHSPQRSRNRSQSRFTDRKQRERVNVNHDWLTMKC